jgi:hypothetical protein
MSAVTSKSIQICYSGVGKEKNGQKKRNFSKTNVYICMQGAKNLYNLLLFNNQKYL